MILLPALHSSVQNYRGFLRYLDIEINVWLGQWRHLAREGTGVGEFNILVTQTAHTDCTGVQLEVAVICYDAVFDVHFGSLVGLLDSSIYTNRYSGRHCDRKSGG